MNLSNAWIGCLIFCLTIVHGCLGWYAPGVTTAWMIKIERYDLLDVRNQGHLKLHCVGVFTGSTEVWTSARCLDTFPKTSHMILNAGDQRFLPTGVDLTPNNQIISISITPPIIQTTYINYIKVCTELNCSFDGPDKYGYQYGYRPLRSQGDRILYLTHYDFSNSSALCREIENGDNKFCTYHDCTSQYGDINIGGEVLTKIYKGQSYLIGFWDHDACDKNIRVFHRSDKKNQQQKPIEFEMHSQH